MARFIKGLFLAATLALVPLTAYAEPISATIGALIIGGGAIGPTAAGAAIYGALSAIAGILATSALSAALAFGVSAISGKGKTRGAGGWAERATSLQTVSRSAIETRKIIIGNIRVSGSLALIEPSGLPGQNAYLHMILLLASHPCNDITEVYLDEKAINPNPYLVVDGVQYYQSSSSAFKASGKDGTSKGADLVICSFRLGSETQTAEPWLLRSANMFPASRRRVDRVGWKSTDRLRGITYLYLELLFSEDRFKSGTPNVQALVEGASDMWDPRDQTFKYSNNWALAVRYYLKKIGIPDSAINDDSVIAAANISDENVNLKNGGTQKRYTVDGVIDLGQQQKEVLDQLAVCGAGAIIYSQGQYHVFAGAYDAPSHDITADWIIGQVDVIPRPPRSEIFNGVKGVYTDGEKETWQPVDFPPISNATYIAQDGGVEIFKDVEYPYVTNSERAQRLAYIQLARHRASLTLTMPLDWRGLNIRVWDTVTVTLSELGLSSAVFRVIDWKFNPAEGVTVTLRQEAANLYDWDENDAIEPNDPGDGNAVGDVPEPGNFVATERTYTSTDGSGVKVAVDLSWTPAGQNEDDITVGSPMVKNYMIGYKLAADTDYTNIAPVSGTSVTLFDFAPGVYDFRIFAVTNTGATSEEVVKRVEVYGLTAKPAALTGFALTAINNQAHLRWDQSTDVDVLVGGSIRVKYSPLFSGAQWETATQIAEDLSGISTAAVVPLLDGTYLLKAVDSTGNEGETAATITSNIVNLLNLNVVKTLTQNPAFLGTKTNMVLEAETGWLKLDSANVWDSLNSGVNIDDWVGNIDSGAGDGISATGEYLFYDSATGLTYVDLGSIYRCRIAISGETLVVSDATAWDDLYPGVDIDSWPGFIDGEDITQTVARYYIRHTDDNPGGSPTWSEWEEFVIGDYEHRGYQFKVVVTNGLESNNLYIKTLEAVIDMPDRLETFEDQSIPLTGGATITYDKPFFSKPEVAGVIQSAQQGDTLKYTHNTSGGKYVSVLVQVLYTSGSPTTRSCDIYVKGY